MVLILPALPVEIASGFLFGFGWGLLVTLIAAMLAACISFIIGRAAGATQVRHALQKCKFGLRLLDALNAAVKERGAQIVLVMQFAGLPTGLKNYGLTVLEDLTLFVFMWTKFVSTACLSPINVYVGSTAHDLVETISGERKLDALQISLMSIGFVCLLIVVAIAVAAGGAMAFVILFASCAFSRTVSSSPSDSDELSWHCCACFPARLGSTNVKLLRSAPTGAPEFM